MNVKMTWFIFSICAPDERVIRDLMLVMRTYVKVLRPFFPSSCRTRSRSPRLLACPRRGRRK